jgi:O-antigen ligase
VILRHAITPVFLGLCLLLGGASAAGITANLLLQLTALPLIGWALWTLRHDPPSGPVRGLLLLLLGLIALCLVQLIPLPPSVWTLLPGREPVARGFALLGLPLPWLPLSLAPAQSLASMIWLLPAIATLLAIVGLGAFRGRWLAWTVVGITTLAVGFGALQLVGGGTYLYAITNRGAAVGFFANANHHATLLLASIPFVAGLQAYAVRRARSRRDASAVSVLTSAAFVVIAVGLLTNLSLAGIGLCLPVALASFMFIRKREVAVRPWVLGVGAAVSIAAVAVIVWGPFGNNLIGEQRENADLSRQTSFARTLSASAEYLPFGSGVGSFVPIYRTQEPPDSVTRTFMNHAHSDWLELLLETGVPGLLLVALFLWWWGRRVVDIWRADEVDYIGRAAAIASATMMVHSVVDYPLRTAALSVLFAACLGLMAGVRPFTPRARQPQNARHRSLEL